jgi:hypothetical protein
VVLGSKLRAHTLNHSTGPIFVLGFSEIGSREIFAWGWLQIAILLIFAFWVARITGVSHWAWIAKLFLILLLL